MRDYFKEEIFLNNIKRKRTKLALSAVQKMFKKNLSSNDTELNLKNNDNISLFE